MSSIEGALVDDVRALLAVFKSSGASAFEVALRNEIKLAILKDPEAMTGGILLCAPHVATVLRLPDKGATVGDDVELILLAVLDEEMPIRYSGPGIVGEILTTVGSLVEFGTPLLRIQDSG